MINSLCFKIIFEIFGIKDYFFASLKTKKEFNYTNQNDRNARWRRPVPYISSADGVNNFI